MYNTGWQFYVLHRVAVVRVNRVALLRITQVGGFTYNTGWQFCV